MSDSFIESLSHSNEAASVLVVDDTSTNRFILSKLLDREGYDVYQATDGQSAISLAQNHLPTLILLDIMMPDMDGYEVCNQLRTNPATAAIPIIFLSALDAPFDKVQAFHRGAADYVTKPFQAEEVLARVRHQINLQLAQQQQQQLNAELENRVQERTQLLELAHDQLLEIALTDRLTRLPNRLSFVKRLSKVMAQAQLNQVPPTPGLNNEFQSNRLPSPDRLSGTDIPNATDVTANPLAVDPFTPAPLVAPLVGSEQTSSQQPLDPSLDNHQLTEGGSNENCHFAVLFLDCDRFKRINDSLGHRVGDQLLKGVARRLNTIQHEHLEVDTVARFGGDEFALLLANIPDRQAVIGIADEVLAALAIPFALAGREIFINASIGLVWGERSYVAAEHLLRDADVAMYRAKDCNRSQYLWFESAMHNRALHLLQLETDLRLALERQEFELYYQPIVDLNHLKIVGFEALVRWVHPTRGLINPNDFINFAEETGFIIPLGELVLTMACEHIAQWERAGLIGPNITVSVNMAAQQLLQPDILERVEAVIQKTGIAARRLRLELTERSIINNRTFVDDVLRALQHRNIQLSIDDFGTGYSSLSYLHTLPVNCLKVDRSFVQPITAKSDSLGIVPLIVNIAKTMNMQVIAEGVETATQLQQLQALGCEYGQGYLFEKAVPAEKAVDLLNTPIEDWMIGSDDWPQNLPNQAPEESLLGTNPDTHAGTQPSNNHQEGWLDKHPESHKETHKEIRSEAHPEAHPGDWPNMASA
ncbi:MAG: EAL domain-containing protein [Cyanobacteria bacterium P01_F01_bin.53]